MDDGKEEEEEEEEVAGARDEELGEAATKREGEEEKGCAKCRGWQVGAAMVPTAKAVHRDGAAASARPRGAGRILRKEFMAVVLCVI